MKPKADICFVQGKERCHCPICGEMVVVRGKRQRTLTESSGNKVKLVIRRMRCVQCKRIHHELPDCVVPYKRHCAETIEAIIKGNTGEVPCDAGVVRRVKLWWKVMLEYYLHILKSLAEKYNIKFSKPAAFKEIIRAAANSNNWISWKKLCTRTE